MFRFNKLFQRRKNRAPEIPAMPSWDEVVSVMYDKQLSFVDEVVEVLYNSEKTMRFVMLKSDRGYYRYRYEALDPFTEEEWRYVSQRGTVLPAIWTEYSGRTSFFGTLDKVWEELKRSPEYKLYFEQNSAIE